MRDFNRVQSADGMLEGNEEIDEFHFEKFSLASRRNNMSRHLTESWRCVEVAAMAIPDESTHSIGSRLGGTLLQGSSHHGKTYPSTHRSPLMNEKTRLLGTEGENDDASSFASDDEHQTPPPLTKWIGVALLCAGCYALYNISIKKGSASINPIMGGVILQFVAALLGSALLGVMIVNGKGNAIYYDRKGLLWSMAAGFCVGTAEIVSFLVSGMGVPATQFIPIIIGGSVMFGSVLGVVTLGETVMLHGWSGVVMLCLGIVLVATDPGEKAEEIVVGFDDSAPPLTQWIGQALLCALAYALYNICIKKGSSSINPIVGAVILQFVAAVYGSCILGTIYIGGVRPDYNRNGILWACWAGLFVGGAELLSFCVSGMGVQASQSIPIIIGGSVGFGAVLGIIMLGEALELQGWLGVLVLMTGIVFVATDPGERVSGH